jgi:tetratricopeptide (TPR) repeat protein
MRKKSTLMAGIALFLAFVGFPQRGYSQTKKPSSSVPRIEVQNYKIEASLAPDAHELNATAAITFKPLQATDIIVFELSENLSVRKVLNSEGVELEFRQDEIGPGFLSIRFPKPLSLSASVTIRVECQGGFDRDRFSRTYTRDESSAYIGMEGTYLMYSAKWFPINRFLVDRATGTVEISVPLGMTVIGPGTQLPVITKGINEVFSWAAKTPILPGSIVAGQYFQKKLQLGDFTIECFSKQSKSDAIQKAAEAAAKILDFYQKSYGPSASGTSFRLVEVDEQLARQPGMLGTIFITRTELSQSLPPLRELARRIAYQWWQETVGIQSDADLWLVDGMAYMSAAQYLGKAEGPSAFKEEIDNLAVLALKFEKKSAIRSGLGLGYRSEQYESVVAGKGAWVLNMLHGILGDSKFNQLVQQYAHEYAGNAASTTSFQKLAEKLHGKELGWFFAEWIETIGVPAFQTEYVTFKTANGFRVSGSVKQDRDLFRMPVEIAVVSDSKEETKTVELNGKSTSFDISVFSAPQKVVLDPNNKLLRDSKELQTSVQLSLGNDLKQKGDFVEAIRAFESAIKLEPHRSLAHFRLAEVFYEQFNLQSAANSFRDALNGDKDPKWIEVWCYIYLGKIYDILGQRQRAMAEYSKAINTKDDTNGAQAEANQWLAAPFSRERTTMEQDKKDP